MSNTMTPERAIEILNPEHREHYDSIETVNEACRMGMVAIGYRIKKKPIEKPTKSFFADLRCPDCKTLIARHQKYCKECGQALDWSDEE